MFYFDKAVSEGILNLINIPFYRYSYTGMGNMEFGKKEDESSEF